jgi:hypothetical protein
MQITLQNIAFNHDPNLNNTGSFFLRRNETQIVPIPEWSNQCSSDPACAPAGYIISKLPATLTIKASFLCDDHSVNTIYIQAVEIPVGSTHILGPAVAANPINLQNGSSGLVSFQLSQAKNRMQAAGVSKTDIAWQWRFSSDGANWTDFQQTNHRIYTVIDKPQCPWMPYSNSTTEIHVPWTAVLDESCDWAAGANHVDVAAEGITRNVYQLGQKRVRYEGAACYARAKFNCTKFLQLLTQGAGKGQTVNCEDCATVVSTFANLLGANLSQSTMGSDFKTNPIRLIGYENWRRKRFGFHEVAWKSDFTATAALFDACLQVDGDGKPDASDPNHTALQPTNLTFGVGQPGSYKFCLFASGKCDPKPGNAQCRSFGTSPLGFPKITDLAFLNVLKERYEFHNWEDRTTFDVPANSLSLLLTELRNAFPGWEIPNIEEFTAENFFNIIELLLKRKGSSQEFLEITIFEVAGREKPTDFLLQLLGHFELLDFELMRDSVVGDVSFVAPEEITVIFKQGRFVAAVRSVGRLETQLIPIATAISLALGKLKPADGSQPIRRDDMANAIGSSTGIARTPKHKLGEEFSVFINATFEENGIMDLSNMDAQGTLTGGTHTHDNTTETINGQATRVVSPLGTGAAYVLHLDTDDLSASYDGLLVFDQDKRLIVAGGYCFKDVRTRLAKGLERAQNDGVWVITKP